jgi:hypothetical protein
MFEGPRIVQPVVTIATVERVTGEATVGASRNRLTEPLASGRQILSGSTVRTGANGYLGLRLASGASVRVDAGTAVEFGSRNVLALERGAIYIDTDDAGPAAAVEVRTPLATARDIGTRFEVRLVASAVRVRVRGGLVRVDQRGAAYDAAPGIELIASAGILERRTVPLHGPDWDWTLRVSPPFAIEGRTLASFLQWVEREGGWHPRFSDPELERSSSSVVLHGSIDGLTPADALAVVLPTCGLTHRVDGDVLRLQRQ